MCVNLKHVHLYLFYSILLSLFIKFVIIKKGEFVGPFGFDDNINFNKQTYFVFEIVLIGQISDLYKGR